MKKNERLVNISEKNRDLVKPVTEYLLTDKSLKESIEEAKNSNILAAREVLESIAFFLSTKNADRNGKPYPVPDFIRDYLSEILYKIVCRKNEEEKEDINKSRTPKNKWLDYIKHAFYLTKSGGKFKETISNYEKRLVADWVFQLKYSYGLSINRACEEVINNMIPKLREDRKVIENKINELQKTIKAEQEEYKKRELAKEIGELRICLARYANYENVCRKFQTHGYEEIKKWYYKYRDELEKVYRDAALIKET